MTKSQIEKFYTYFEKKLVEQLHFNQGDLKEALNDWLKSRGDNQISRSDFYWSCFNHALLESAKSSSSLEEMYKRQREINLVMWEFLIREGKNGSSVQKEIHKLDVQIAEFMNFEVDFVVVGTHDCTYGAQIDGLKFSMAEAKTKIPIDYEKCDRPRGCVCRICMEVKRDSTGRLISKKDNWIYFIDVMMWDINWLIPRLKY